MTDQYKSQEGLQCLEIINSECGSAFTCKPGWSVKKRIKKCEKEEKDVCTTVFKGDTVKVPYIIKVDQEKNNNIDFVWPITIANVGSCKTEGLKVGVKVFLVFSNKCDDDSDSEDKGKGKKKSHGNKHHGDLYLGTFDGFEKDHSYLKPYEQHRYMLVGSVCPKDNISIKDAKLKLIAQVSICDGPNGKCSNPCAEIFIKIDPPCKPHNDSVVLVDKDIEFCRKVFKNDTITVNALFTPGDNIECGKKFVNKAKLYAANKGGRDEHDDDHASDCELGKYDKSNSDDEGGDDKPKHNVSCSHGEALIGKNTEAKASLTIDCAKVVLKCNSVNTCCVDDWCLKQCSCVDDNIIEYKIVAEKSKLRDAKAHLDAKIKIEGPVPKYDKEFKLELYACNEHGKPSQLIESVDFKLGCVSQSFNWDCKEVKLCDDNSGKFVFVLSYRKQIWDLGCCAAEYDKCEPHISTNKINCKEGEKDSRACIKNDLCVPDGIRYCIEDSGSFESKERLKEFLKGASIEIRNSRKIKYSLKFKKSCGNSDNCRNVCCRDGKNKALIVNTVKLTAKSDCHANSIVNTIEDEIALEKRHKDDKKHDSDSSDESSNDNIRVPHKPKKPDCDDAYRPKKRDCDDDNCKPRKRDDDDYHPKKRDWDDDDCKPRKRDCDDDYHPKKRDWDDDCKPRKRDDDDNYHPKKRHNRDSDSSERDKRHSLPIEEFGPLKIVPNYDEINRQQYSRVFNKAFGMKPSEGLALTRFRQ